MTARPSRIKIGPLVEAGRWDPFVVVTRMLIEFARVAGEVAAGEVEEAWGDEIRRMGVEGEGGEELLVELVTALDGCAPFGVYFGVWAGFLGWWGGTISCSHCGVKKAPLEVIARVDEERAIHTELACGNCEGRV